MNNATIEVLKETIKSIEKANQKWEVTCDVLTMDLRTVRAELRATKAELAEKTATLNALTALVDKYVKE
jgi:prefoldin subunit 5